MGTRRRRCCAPFLATCAALAAALSLAPGALRAQSPQGVGPAPIVRIVLAGGAVNVRTWDRPSVAIQDAGGLSVRHFTVQAGGTSNTVPILAGRFGDVQLPAESFAVTTLAAGAHDVVAIRGREANVTVTVPRSSALVTVQMGNGHVSVNDYRDGTFIARLRSGSAHLSNVGGDGYVEVLRGPVAVEGSSFRRVRVRSGTGDVVFANTHAKQIEVTSVRGSIVYDGGSFEPGLARFQTQSGNVALGVNGPAQLAANTEHGRVFLSLDAPSQVSGRNAERLAVLHGGGPVVNATSASGNVYLYSGRLASRRTTAEWRPLRETMVAAGYPVPAQMPQPAARPHRIAAPHRFAAPPRRRIAFPPPPHRFAAPPPRRFAAPPPHRFAAPPPHRFAAPPPRPVRAPHLAPRVERPRVIPPRAVDRRLQSRRPPPEAPRARPDRPAQRRFRVTPG